MALILQSSFGKGNQMNQKRRECIRKCVMLTLVHLIISACSRHDQSPPLPVQHQATHDVMHFTHYFSIHMLHTIFFYMSSCSLFPYLSIYIYMHLAMLFSIHILLLFFKFCCCFLFYFLILQHVIEIS